MDGCHADARSALNAGQQHPLSVESLLNLNWRRIVLGVDSSVWVPELLRLLYFQNFVEPLKPYLHQGFY